MNEIALLRRLGMTDYEARTYLSLAKLGPSPVKDIVADSKLPRNKVYESLQRLEQAGRIALLPVSPMKYRIVNPEKFAEEVKSMEMSASSLISMVNSPKINNKKELFWIMRGQKAVAEKIAFQNSLAEKEIVGCNTLSNMMPRNIRTMREAIKKGVSLKMICLLSQKNINVCREWLKIGAHIRIFNEKKFGSLLPRISIFDGKIARLTVGKPEVPRPEDYITLWTESKAFAQMLRKHFLTMWKECEPIEKYLKN